MELHKLQEMKRELKFEVFQKNEAYAQFEATLLVADILHLLLRRVERCLDLIEEKSAIPR